MNDTTSSRSGKHLYAEIFGTTEIPDPTRAMDALIAGDVDLYDVPHSEQDAWEWLHKKYTTGHPNDRVFGSDDMVDAFMEGRSTLPRDIGAFATALETGLDFNVMKHLDVQMCCNGQMCGCRGATVGQYLAHELRTASARIKGHKDRENPVERPQPVAWIYVRNPGEWPDAPNVLTPIRWASDDPAHPFWTETPLYAEPIEMTEQHLRDLKDAAAFMGKRDAQIELLTELAHQYLSDMRYPPSADSKERRIARIEKVLKEVQP